MLDFKVTVNCLQSSKVEVNWKQFSVLNDSKFKVFKLTQFANI